MLYVFPEDLPDLGYPETWKTQIKANQHSSKYSPKHSTLLLPEGPVSDSMRLWGNILHVVTPNF